MSFAPNKGINARAQCAAANASSFASLLRISNWLPRATSHWAVISTFRRVETRISSLLLESLLHPQAQVIEAFLLSEDEPLYMASEVGLQWRPVL